MVLPGGINCWLCPGLNTIDSLDSLEWYEDESLTSPPGTSIMLGNGFCEGLAQSEQSQW